MHVFLSYAKADTYDLAMQLDAEINALPDVTCWVDREITPGHSWARQIQRQIDRCDLMVVLISPDVNRDPDGERGLSFVINEIAHAQAQRKTIVPVLAQRTIIPIEISAIQFIDCVANLKTGQTKLLAHIQQLSGYTEPNPNIKQLQPNMQLSNIEQLKFDYWKAFNQLLKLENSVIKPRKPYPRHYADYAIGRSNFHLSTAINTQTPNINSNLIITDHTKTYFHMLRQDKEAIETEIGTNLLWKELPGKKSSLIGLYNYDFDPNNRQDWGRQHAWLKYMIESFYDVFQPRIKILNLNNYKATVSLPDILPQPFEWVHISAGQVTLTPNASHNISYLKKAMTFNVPAFTIAQYPITVAQYAVFSENKFDKTKSNHPVTKVNWYDTIKFCQWLSTQTGLTITLPTEQQWQRAAQGDTGWEYPWGNEFDNSRCNTRESGIGTTISVSQHPASASPYGVQDMIGNVWEWCLTDEQTGINHINNTNTSRRVLRGGSWNNYRAPKTAL